MHEHEKYDLFMCIEVEGLCTRKESKTIRETLSKHLLEFKIMIKSLVFLFVSKDMADETSESIF